MENKNFDTEKCPEHDVVVKFIPPSKVNKNRKKLIVTFECPHGHIITKEFDLN